MCTTGLAASVLSLSQTNQAFGAEISNNHLCQLANAADNMPTLPIDEGTKLLMMRGMTASNFDPARYSGRWFEVASLKRGFAGQGVYTFDVAAYDIQVDTFCAHGGPDGYITGIRGKVQSVSFGGRPGED